MRPAFTSPQRAAFAPLLALLLSTFACANHQNHEYILCQKPNSKLCLTWPLPAEIKSIDDSWGDVKMPRFCGIITLQTVPSRRRHYTVNSLHVGGTPAIIYCNSVKMVYENFDWALGRTLIKPHRTRRQATVPRGRYRGQTQSQYLAIDNSGKDEGKAEAHSAADTSRASVSGNSGMGQAQSQSMYDPSCDDCYGRPNAEVGTLTKRPYGSSGNANGGAPGWNGIGNKGDLPGNIFVPNQNTGSSLSNFSPNAPNANGVGQQLGKIPGSGINYGIGAPPGTGIIPGGSGLVGGPAGGGPGYGRDQTGPTGGYQPSLTAPSQGYGPGQQGDNFGAPPAMGGSTIPNQGTIGNRFGPSNNGASLGYGPGNDRVSGNGGYSPGGSNYSPGQLVAPGGIVNRPSEPVGPIESGFKPHQIGTSDTLRPGGGFSGSFRPEQIGQPGSYYGTRGYGVGPAQGATPIYSGPGMSGDRTFSPSTGIPNRETGIFEPGRGLPSSGGTYVPSQTDNMGRNALPVSTLPSSPGIDGNLKTSPNTITGIGYGPASPGGSSLGPSQGGNWPLATYNGGSAGPNYYCCVVGPDGNLITAGPSTFGRTPSGQLSYGNVPYGQGPATPGGNNFHPTGGSSDAPGNLRAPVGLGTFTGPNTGQYSPGQISFTPNGQRDTHVYGPGQRGVTLGSESYGPGQVSGPAGIGSYNLDHNGEPGNGGSYGPGQSVGIYGQTQGGRQGSSGNYGPDQQIGQGKGSYGTGQGSIPGSNGNYGVTPGGISAGNVNYGPDPNGSGGNYRPGQVIRPGAGISQGNGPGNYGEYGPNQNGAGYGVNQNRSPGTGGSYGPGSGTAYGPNHEGSSNPSGHYSPPGGYGYTPTQSGGIGPGTYGQGGGGGNRPGGIPGYESRPNGGPIGTSNFRPEQGSGPGNGNGIYGAGQDTTPGHGSMVSGMQYPNGAQGIGSTNGAPSYETGISNKFGIGGNIPIGGGGGQNTIQYGYDPRFIGQNRDYNGVPQNFTDPSALVDGDDSEAEASVAQAANGTTASASSKGGNDKGRAQTHVHGTYTGSGSFSAQAQISGENKEAESEVTGGKKGASSSAQGSGRNNKSQANVQLGSETGSIQTQSLSNGAFHSSNSQVQGSVKGGMADAQARGPGSTSSQAQIGFTPYKDGDKTHEIQKIPFAGGGVASAQSSGRTGQSQSQLHGTFKYGITYNGAAQAGGSVDKDAVFPNRLSFDKIDVFDESEKNINVDIENSTASESSTTVNPPPSLDQVPSAETIPSEQDTLTETTGPALDTSYTTNGENKKNDETLKNSESRYSSHTHLDHHPQNGQDIPPSAQAGSTRSFQSRYGSNGADYEYTTDREESQPDEYDTDGAEVEQGEYSNYDDIRDSPTHQSLHAPRKELDLVQTTGGNTQHIVLDSLTNHDAEITQKNSERPDEGKTYQPGERIPGTGGYTIPIGFTGSVKSVASKEKTYVVGSRNSPSQAQTVTLTPGTGKVRYSHPSSYGKYVDLNNLRSLHPKSRDDRYVSVSKSVTRDLDSDDNIRKQYSHSYYTKSSSCGFFTFTCTMVSGAEGRKKVCKPKIPTNPDGTPIRC